MADKTTQPRLDVTKVSPDLFKAMAGLEKYVEASGLEAKTARLRSKNSIPLTASRVFAESAVNVQFMVKDSKKVRRIRWLSRPSCIC